MTSLTQLPPLMSAARLLVQHEIIGLAWLDSELSVRGRYGSLASHIDVGEPLRASMPILADYEDDIEALPHDGTGSFTLPGIMLVNTDGKDSPRIDIAVFRNVFKDNPSSRETQPNPSPPLSDQVRADGAFLLLITRASHQSTSDVAIARYQRDRRMFLEQIEQQKLELDKTNAELELCNRDLEDYATIISHDLKAPMRILRYLADDVEAGVAQANREKIHEACTALKAQSRRMSTMLSQLLDYASLGRKTEAVEVVDSQQLIETVVASLPRPANFQIEIRGQWPKLATYIAPLDLVLRNLIDNAIKHHDNKTPGRIEISGCNDADDFTISIADNGPGIPLGRQEAIFFPFRSYRLDSAGEPLPNEDLTHGMGLAFVKRTVDNIGGELKLQSDPKSNRGSEFKISWPRHPIASEDE
jgi:signal transduction histidine kinase